MNIDLLNNPASTATENGQNVLFLRLVQRRAGLEDLYDARDIAEVVFRTMRDLMPKDAIDRVTQELEAVAPTQDEETGLSDDLPTLWQDSNPLVRWLSRKRSPMEIKPDTFVFRISQEAGLSRGCDPVDTIEAVFSAFKRYLSSDRINEIAQFLPGEVRQLWRRA